MITARIYHDVVAHSRGKLTGMGVDWVNQPSKFKSYGGVRLFSLPRDVDLPEVSLWRVPNPGEAKPLGLDELSAILFHGAGLTRSSPRKERESFYRACPSAGALYPCEAYLAWPGGAGLDAGLYHYDVGGHGLTELRTGFPTPASLGLPHRSSLEGEAFVFVTAIFYRTAWKYRTRAYRYLNLDAGHMVEGLALGFGAYDVPVRVELNFDDAAVAGFLGIDAALEGCLSVIRFCPGHGRSANGNLGPLPEDSALVSRCSPADAPMSGVQAVHSACSRLVGQDAAMPPARHTRLGAGLNWQGCASPSGFYEQTKLFPAMSARRSRRNFISDSQYRGAMLKMLASLSGPLYPPGGHPAEEACTVGVLSPAAPPIPMGFSLFDRLNMRIGLRRDGDMREAMAKVCLDQLWMRDAAMHVLFLVDFSELEPCLGDRGYRGALQAAGRLGHRLYLAAESLGIGACGVGAFFDGDAAELLGLPDGAGLAYVVAVGPTRSR